MLQTFARYAATQTGLLLDLTGFAIISIGAWKGSILAAKAARLSQQVQEYEREAAAMPKRMREHEEMMRVLDGERPTKDLARGDLLVRKLQQTVRTLSEKYFALHTAGMRIERRALTIGTALIGLGFLLMLVGSFAQPAVITEYRWLGWAG